MYSTITLLIKFGYSDIPKVIQSIIALVSYGVSQFVQPHDLQLIFSGFGKPKIDSSQRLPWSPFTNKGGSIFLCHDLFDVPRTI